MTTTTDARLRAGKTLTNGNIVISSATVERRPGDSIIAIILAICPRQERDEYVTHAVMENDTGGIFCEMGHYYSRIADATADFNERIERGY